MDESRTSEIIADTIESIIVNRDEYYNYIKSRYKSNEERGSIAVVINVDADNNSETIVRYYSSEDVKKSYPNAAQFHAKIDKYERDSEFVMIVMVGYCGEMIRGRTQTISII